MQSYEEQSNAKPNTAVQSDAKQCKTLNNNAKLKQCTAKQCETMQRNAM